MIFHLGNRQKLKESMSLGYLSIVAFHATKVPTIFFLEHLSAVKRLSIIVCISGSIYFCLGRESLFFCYCLPVIVWFFLPFGTWYGLRYFVVALAGPSINYLESDLRQNCCTQGKFN